MHGRLVGRASRTPRPARFAVVGGIGAGANIVFLAWLVQGLHVEPEIANVVQLVVITQLNFLLSRWWTWGDRRDVPFYRALWRFQLTRALGAIAHQAFFVAIIAHGVHYLIAAGFCLVVIAIGNYIVGDLFVFSAPCVRSQVGCPEAERPSGGGS